MGRLWGRNAEPEQKPSIGETANAYASSIKNAISGTLGSLMPSRKTKITAAAAAGAIGIAGGGWLLTQQFTTNAYLERLDENYRDKCYSANENVELTTSTMARDRMNKVIDLVRSFGDRGAKSAAAIEKGESVFCFGIDDPSVSPKEHWSMYGVYFSSSEYRPEMMAMYLASDDKAKFWNSHMTVSSSINQYVPESSLVFSRAQRAAPSLENIRDYFNALDKTRSLPNDLQGAGWKAFLQENGNLENTINAYISVMRQKWNEPAAMMAAFDVYMKDPAAIGIGDLTHLEEYKYHVTNVAASNYTAIYESGFSEYAYVDVDRDGWSDDRILLNGFNHAVNYELDASRTYFMSRKTETTTCTRTNDKGETERYRCEEDVSETVYYQKIPAIDTATVHLHPQTLVDLAKQTGTEFLSLDAANVIVADQAYARTNGAGTAALMEEINMNIGINIPTHDTGKQRYGLGLNLR